MFYIDYNTYDVESIENVNFKFLLLPCFTLYRLYSCPADNGTVSVWRNLLTIAHDMVHHIKHHYGVSNEKQGENEILQPTARGTRPVL